MEITIKSKQVKPTIKYPYYGIYTDDIGEEVEPLIVLFTAPRTGVCISPESRIGDGKDKPESEEWWSESVFIPFHGEITIKV